MTVPHLTLLFAGLCALLQTALTALVIRQRTQARVSLLDGGNQPLLHRIRAHGNFVETAPMALLLMALLEMNGLAAAWLWGFGGLLVVGRVLHAYGLLSGRVGLPRLLGMSMTLFVISVEGVVCLWMFAR
jgi:uncharacterized membrane protein YecN with MAPEG domain